MERIQILDGQRWTVNEETYKWTNVMIDVVDMWGRVKIT
jgi:hypothetical protein